VSDIFIGKYRKGTNTVVTFPTLPSLTAQPRRIDLYQKQYSHDVLVLEYPAESTLWFESLQTGVPIEFRWNQNTLSKSWIGYVSSTSKSNSPQRVNSMNIVCVGGSFPLKDRAARVFVDSSIPRAVEQIVTEYGFNFIGEDNNQKFPQLTIAGLTYWEWIVEQSKRIGYGIIVDGMNFIFKPIDKLIDFGFSSAAILSIGDATVPFNTQALDRTLDMFNVISGDNIEDSVNYRTIKNVGGVNPVSSEEYLAEGNPLNTGNQLRSNASDVLFSEYRTDRVVQSAEAAKTEAEGAAELARFNLPATVRGQGDPRIRPFSTVFISGTGNLTDGFWVVKEAKHMFHKIGDYMIDLKIATDGLGDSLETSFRTRDASAVGLVNVDEALKNKGISPLYFDMASVELNSTGMIVKEANQGYNKVIQKWKAR
jgi:hypothetical protein